MKFVDALGWRVQAVAILGLTSLALAAALAAFGLWRHPILALAAALIFGTTSTCLALSEARTWLGRMDWRIGAILVATALSTSATLIGFDAELNGERVDRFLHEVFAGWVAGIAFFGVVGVVVAVVSIVRPESEDFETRARILFQGQTGRHIEYIVEKLRDTFEHFAELVVDEIKIVNYDFQEMKFLLVSEAETTVKPYIIDARSRYKSAVRMEDVSAPPPGGRGNVLVYLDVGETHYGSFEFVDGSINVPIETIIDSNGQCTIRYQMEHWTKAESEENSFCPARYTQRARLSIRNSLPGGQTVKILLTRVGKFGAEEHLLVAGQRYILCDASDIAPNEQIWDFRILPLT